MTRIALSTKVARPATTDQATGRVPTRAVVAPPRHERAPVWERPVPAIPDQQSPAPLVWLLGAHGGAGVTTLAHLLAPAADCYRRWPAALGGESRYVVLVARETVIGLAAADALARQHHAGLAGDSELIGLITVAARPGRIAAPIRRDLTLYSGLVDHTWSVGWHEAFTLAPHNSLPVWSPLAEDSDTAPNITTSREAPPVPPDASELGQQVVAVITALEHARHTTNGESR